MSYFRMGDPDTDFARRDREEAEWLSHRPLCGYCNQPIGDERCMDIDAELYHIHCAVRLFGVDTEEFT